MEREERERIEYEKRKAMFTVEEEGEDAITEEEQKKRKENFIQHVKVKENDIKKYYIIIIFIYLFIYLYNNFRTIRYHILKICPPSLD